MWRSGHTYQEMDDETLANYCLDDINTSGQHTTLIVTNVPPYAIDQKCLMESFYWLAPPQERPLLPKQTRLDSNLIYIQNDTNFERSTLVRLNEWYKIPNKEPATNEVGEWSLETGLRMTKAPIWERRADLQGTSISCAIKLTVNSKWRPNSRTPKGLRLGDTFVEVLKTMEVSSKKETKMKSGKTGLVLW